MTTENEHRESAAELYVKLLNLITDYPLPAAAIALCTLLSELPMLKSAVLKTLAIDEHLQRGKN